jgi:hypothetical protein
LMFSGIVILGPYSDSVHAASPHLELPVTG